MAELHELIEKIENPELRAQIAEAAKRALKHKQFGLVFEEHLPECTPLYDIPVRKGSLSVGGSFFPFSQSAIIFFLYPKHAFNIF